MNHREVHLIRRRVLAFDLDGTLATTKSPVSVSIVCLLGKALETFDVCVISGGAFSQFERQLIDRLHLTRSRLARLHLMPTSGTRYFRYDSSAGSWVQQYAEDLTERDKRRSSEALERGARRLGYWESAPHGAIIEDRGSQITFSALGQDAPPALKCAWDPGGVKKEALRLYTAEELPDLEVRAGGTTSIDITRHGVDKAYGMRRLMTVLDVRASEVVYFGDQLDEGGNDHPVRAGRDRHDRRARSARYRSRPGGDHRRRDMTVASGVHRRPHVQRRQRARRLLLRRSHCRLRRRQDLHATTLVDTDLRLSRARLCAPRHDRRGSLACAGRRVHLPRVSPRRDHLQRRGRRAADDERAPMTSENARPPRRQLYAARDQDPSGVSRRRAVTSPASQPGARPPSGCARRVVSMPARHRIHEVTEFEFHISPASSSSLPHTGVGTDGTRSSSRSASARSSSRIVDAAASSASGITPARHRRIS